MNATRFNAANGKLTLTIAKRSVVLTMIHKKREFIDWLARLPIRKSTFATYVRLVKRIAKVAKIRVDQNSIASEQDVQNVVNGLIGREFVGGYRKDLRLMLRYYLKFVHPMVR